MDFTENVIAELFGHEAAEDENIDRLKAYYLKSSARFPVGQNQGHFFSDG